jgi:hypothetical protein
MQNPLEDNSEEKTPEPDINNENIVTSSEVICGDNECKTNDVCYPLGFRKSGEYCSENNRFLLQLGTNAQCNNNFECGSNVCVSGQCIETSFIQKILEWFRKLFGGE